MNIKFKPNETELMECLVEFMKLDEEDRLTMSMYDLAKLTDINDSQRWVEFLSHPTVSESISKEFTLYTESQKRKLVSLATTDHRSTGAAQMISALGKTTEDAGTTSGEIFIYSYVPLNQKEARIPGVQTLSHDIFDKGEVHDEDTHIHTNASYECTAEQAALPEPTEPEDNIWERKRNARSRNRTQ